jgi:hypothetical protein
MSTEMRAQRNFLACSNSREFYRMPKPFIPLFWHCHLRSPGLLCCSLTRHRAGQRPLRPRQLPEGPELGPGPGPGRRPAATWRYQMSNIATFALSSVKPAAKALSAMGASALGLPPRGAGAGRLPGPGGPPPGPQLAPHSTARAGARWPAAQVEETPRGGRGPLPVEAAAPGPRPRRHSDSGRDPPPGGGRLGRALCTAPLASWS